MCLVALCYIGAFHGLLVLQLEQEGTKVFISLKVALSTPLIRKPFSLSIFLELPLVREDESMLRFEQTLPKPRQSTTAEDL